MSRYDAPSKGLDALLRKPQIRSSTLNRNIKSPAQSEVFRRTMGQVSRNYRATVSLVERCERAQKIAHARWNPNLRFVLQEVEPDCQTVWPQ